MCIKTIGCCRLGQGAGGEEGGGGDEMARGGAQHTNNNTRYLEGENNFKEPYGGVRRKHVPPRKRHNSRITLP